MRPDPAKLKTSPSALNDTLIQRKQSLSSTNPRSIVAAIDRPVVESELDLKLKRRQVDIFRHLLGIY